MGKILNADTLGMAVHNYHFKKDNTPVIVTSQVVEDEKLPPDYFFRGYREFPKLEKIALQKCKGKILDIGACAGCHSLYLQKKGFDVTAMEISTLCCEVLKDRGIKNILNADIFQFEGQKYDTILLLMNGVGIAGNVDGLKKLLLHLNNLLTPEGSILIDSSDLIYLYTEEDGSVLFDINAEKYYGEIDYTIIYKEMTGECFSWLFADSVLLSEIAETSGYKMSIVEYGPHYDFLAELKPLIP
jgi:hypothetical protein